MTDEHDDEPLDEATEHKVATDFARATAILDMYLQGRSNETMPLVEMVDEQERWGIAMAAFSLASGALREFAGVEEGRRWLEQYAFQDGDPSGGDPPPTT